MTRLQEIRENFDHDLLPNPDDTAYLLTELEAMTKERDYWKEKAEK